MSPPAIGTCWKDIGILLVWNQVGIALSGQLKLAAARLCVVYWLTTDGETDWFMVALLAAAAVVGVLIGNRIRRRGN